MGSFSEIFGILAGIVSLVSYILYIVSIIRRKTIPNRATWFILTIVSMVIASSYYTLGARDTIWAPLAFVIGCSITFLLSIRYGEGGWTLFDKLCLLGAGISLILWLISHNALVALLMNIAIDFLGVMPTIRKSYVRPESEEKFPWIITFIAGVLNVLAINTWTFAVWVYPVYIILADGLVAYFLCFPRRKSTKAI